MIRLVAFDVDGTLLRGPTLCECIAAGIGKLEAMHAIERLTDRSDITAARYEMLSWYRPHERATLLRHVRSAVLAPGAREGIAALRQSGVRVALVSITWEFAVQWLASELDADFVVGTRWHGADTIEHFWPEDKATWLSLRATELQVLSTDVAAVGDSAGDLAMLRWAGTGYFVGSSSHDLPPHVRYWPAADIGDIARDILAGRHQDTTGLVRTPTDRPRDP
jgi:HAD superfamily phosphoserine phosphatase-like hydrolase